jgi:hypothetical protein
MALSTGKKMKPPTITIPRIKPTINPGKPHKNPFTIPHTIPPIIQILIFQLAAEWDFGRLEGAVGSWYVVSC